MQYDTIKFIVLLLCIQIKINLGQEVLERNTDYKVLHEGHELELTCKNNVDPLLAVAWTLPSYIANEKYSLNIKDGNIFTFTIKNAKREDAGKYTCKSLTRNGAELTKDIHVGVPPLIKLFESGEEIKDNKMITKSLSGKAKLKCKEGDATYPKPVREWRKNGEILDDENREDFTVTESGNYTCKLANSIGSSSRTAYITIKMCPGSFICKLGLDFGIIGLTSTVIYFFMYICRAHITDKEFTIDISATVTFVIVLIYYIALIIVHHSFACKMVLHCTFAIMFGTLSTMIVAVDVWHCIR